MKVKISLSSDDGITWTAECKDIGLSAIGASMMSALEDIELQIQEFFTNSFGSQRQIEVVCSKIKATAYVTVSPLEEPRPEKPLDCYTTNLVPEDHQIENDEQLVLSSGNPDCNIGDTTFTISDSAK
jgi:hypothetical protein